MPAHFVVYVFLIVRFIVLIHQTNLNLLTSKNAYFHSHLDKLNLRLDWSTMISELIFSSLLNLF